jgi:hypothetical protein
MSWLEASRAWRRKGEREKGEKKFFSKERSPFLLSWLLAV